MSGCPSGFVAFLFTDLEGSTRLWERFPDAMPAVYARHDAVLRAAAAAAEGAVYKVVGDALQIAFPTPAAAFAAAIAAQRRLVAEHWPIDPPPRVRMALHCCDVAPQPDGDYRTPGLNRLGRLLAAAHGGQILLSQAFAAALPAGFALRDLGEHRFRDLAAQHVFQATAEGLPDDFGPLVGLERPGSRLPAPGTSLIGRNEALAVLTAILADPANRLVTIVGPGGIGKTRLALALAARLAAGREDGVWWVPLADLTDPAAAAPAIAAALDLREDADRPALAAVSERLDSRAALLVLDNVEQVIAAAADVASLLRDCPRLQIVVTSRAPLRIAGEREFPAAPLAAPELPARAAVGFGAAAVGGFAAVQLFVERARAIRPDFALTDANAVPIARICRRLDGLPLAIELAAAHVRLLSPARLLERLDLGLPFLAGGGRDAPDRQRTLRATIDWSYGLLDPPCRALFARLAVFAGGATIEAVVQICGADLGDDPLAALERLAEQSLIRLDDDGVDAVRVTMLETIREYARERFDATPERDRVIGVHADWLIDLAAAAEPELSGPDQADWLERLEREHDNFRIALENLSRLGRPADRLRLAGSLWRFWWVRGHLGEGRDQLREAIAGVSDDDPALAQPRARALDGAGALAEAQGDIDQAEALHRAALAAWRAAGDRRGAARALDNLGIIALHDRGDPAAAREAFDAALTLYRDAGDDAGAASALSNLGDAALTEEDYAAADALLRETLAMAEARGDVRGIAAGLTSLGALAFFQGDHPQAVALYERSLPLWRRLGDAQGEALVLGNLGEALQQLRQPDRAGELYAACLAAAEDLGDRQGVAFALSHLGELAREAGEDGAALRRFAEGAAICQEIGDLARLAECLEGFAGALTDSDPAAAVGIMAAAAALRTASGLPLPTVHRAAHERDVGRLRAALPPDAFEQAWTAGGAMPLDDVAQRLRTMATSLAADDPRPSRAVQMR
jgi:predicted ATPase/class 3 adenylate cyclase